MVYASASVRKGICGDLRLLRGLAMCVDITSEWLCRRAIFKLSYRGFSFGCVGYLVELGPAVVDGPGTLGLSRRSL